MYVCMTMWNFNRIYAPENVDKPNFIHGNDTKTTICNTYQHAFTHISLPNTHIYNLKKLKGLETNIYGLYSSIIFY